MRTAAGADISRLARKLPVTGARTLPEWWRAAAGAYGPFDAIREHGGGVTYRELDQRSARLARALLAQGMGKGSRVGLLFANGSDWIASWLAISRIGGIAVGLSTFFSPTELAYALGHADVAVLLSADRYLRHDYCAKLEQGLPSLVGADGRRPLVLLEAPHLRAIWIAGDQVPAWSHGSLTELEVSGANSEVYSADLLTNVERTVAPADLAMIVFTSGTTAVPKAVVHSQRVVSDKIIYLAEVDTLVPFDMGPGDRPLVTAPAFWVGGFLTVGGALSVGAAVVCENNDSPAAALATIRSENVTHVGGWGSFTQVFEELGARPEELEHLKPLGAPLVPLTPQGKHIPRERFPNSLGMSETMGPHSGVPTGGLLEDGKEGSFGRALPGMDFKIVDPVSGARLPAGTPGELFVRGRWLMDGFYKRDKSETFDPDGYYGTGDHCTLDEDGYLYFRGRLDGMIKTSGANVSPEEVEAPLCLHPDVLEAAVFGIPHRKAGQMVVAVVAKRQDSPLSEVELQRFLRDRLSSFKVPKRIVFMSQDALPKTVSQKIRKGLLAQMLANDLAPS